MLKLLIVEDERNLGILYAEEFRHEGYEVILARNGNEAVEKTRAHNPDAVILDIRLPDISGITAMKEMLAYNKELPIIINSAYSSYMDDFNCWAAKAYIIKSGDLKKLKNTVAKYLCV